MDNGGATWIHGSMYQYAAPTQEAATGNRAQQAGMDDRYSDFTVRYGVGSPTDSNCIEPITWYTAEQITAGAIAWEDVNKVEVYLEKQPGGNVAEIRTNVSIAMRVLNNAPSTLIETNVNASQDWFSPRYDSTSISVSDLRAKVYTADGTIWQRMSSYDEVANNAGESTTARMGDRLTHVDMLARVDKQVQSHLGAREFVSTDLWTPDDSQHVATQPTNPADIAGEYEAMTAPPIYGPGSTFDFLLTPTLDANPMPASGTMFRDILVEDCLPASIRLNYVEGDPMPEGWAMYLQSDLDASRQPYHKTPMACAPGESYVAFYRPNADVTTPLAPIQLPVRVLETAMSGGLVNTSEISLMSSFLAPTSDADPSLFTQRSDRARIHIQAPDGLRVAKATLNPVVFVDELLNVSTPTVTWELEARNINSGRVISNVDLIDYLPESGVNTSNYVGERNFISATVVSGTNVELYYTSATLGGQSVSAWSDPANPSNQAGGSTVWCNADNTATFPAGGDLAACPQGPQDVTGVRVFRPGVFENGASVHVNLLMSAEGRVTLDTPDDETIIMKNEVVMRADGLDVPLFSEATAIWFHRDVPPNPGSISGEIWDDLNSNGVWDEGEPPLAGVTVTATGVPIWCTEKWLPENFEDPAFVCPETTLSAVTDANGRYTIGGVYPGLAVDPNDPIFGPREPYLVQFVTPPGYETTLPGRSLAPSTYVELNSTNQFVKGIDAGYRTSSASIAKSVADAEGNPAVDVRPGEVLTYTVTITNATADRPFTEDFPATFVDSLADVLDESALVGEPTASAGSVAVVDDQIVWTGPLPAGGSVTVTYTVLVDGAVGEFLTNVAFLTDEPIDPDTGVPTNPETGEPVTPPAPGECAAPGCATTSTEVVPVPVPPTPTPPAPSPTPPAPGPTPPAPSPTPKPKPLPASGADVSGLLIGAGLLLTGGIAALEARRRRA